MAAIATTPTGVKKLQTLSQIDSVNIWVPESLADMPGTQVYTGSLKQHIANLWQTHRAFIFCLATGAVVRLIAPLLRHKSTDPAVITLDEAGRFVISLCGGHQGGGDKLAQLIALQLNATPVLSGASASLGLPAVDTLGVPFGWKRGEGDWTGVSASVARGERVQVIQETGSTLWQTAFSTQPSAFIFQEDPSATAKIWITSKLPHTSPIPQIHWYPRVLWIGIGCERGTSEQLLETAIQQVFQQHQLAESAIAGIATIDIKSDEVGLVKLCQKRNLPLKTFSSDILSKISVPNPSQVVEKEVGTPSVAEAAALCAAQSQTLLIAKQIFKPSLTPLLPHSSPPLQGAVTIAIAQAEKEYIGRTGELLLIGTGPGQINQMTPAAQAAVTSADAIIGYSLYVDLIHPILRPGQIVEALPITKERQRAQRAIELANWGLQVAVISSGDCGIYGMAGLVLEELQTQDWDGKTPKIQIFPGITAMQAAASRVGTPLMHDFCAISLSDLLTPWEMIEKRLEAAAVADFVTALYNPRSQTRIQQLVTAREIFLKYRNSDTPVAVVRSAYREDEQITLTTLDKLLDVSIDMLTTVLIGNSNTRFHANWMVTPRGYLGFANS
uniref:Precorrin-3 methylase n=1 Tax=Tolypothrix bouteillei VB521301 TaxID=1479485 RepID=A0A0C1QWP0_9CYAN